MIYIGIDPGTHTGLAVWDSETAVFAHITTTSIHNALDFVKSINDSLKGVNDVIVVMEDAKQRRWYGADSDKKMQGAGSIKRDCSIWEDFCKDYGISLIQVPPMKGGTKVSPEYFKLLTGWQGRTSNHARDAALLVLGR